MVTEEGSNVRNRPQVRSKAQTVTGEKNGTESPSPRFQLGSGYIHRCRNFTHPMSLLLENRDGNRVLVG